MADTYRFGVAVGVSAAGTIVWSGHGEVGADPHPEAAGAITVESSSADDSDGGGGLETIRLYYIRLIDGVLEREIRDVELNGTTPVDIGVADGFRILRAYGLTGLTNVGDVDFLIGGVLANRIPAGIGQTESAFWTTPTGVKAHLRGVHVWMLKGSGADPSAIVKWWSKPAKEAGPWRVFTTPVTAAAPVGNLPVIIFPGNGPVVEPESDVKVEVFEFAGTSADIVAGIHAHVGHRNVW